MTEGLGHARGEVSLGASDGAGQGDRAPDDGKEPGDTVGTVVVPVAEAVAAEDIFVTAAAAPRVRQPAWFRRGRHSATPGRAPVAATVVPSTPPA